MCIQDVEIGLETVGNLISRGLTTEPSLLVGPADNRRVLILFPNSATNYMIQFSPDSGTQPFFTVFSGGNPVVLNGDNQGDIVRRGLYAYVAAGTLTVSVYEGLFNIEHFRKGITYGRK